MRADLRKLWTAATPKSSSSASPCYRDRPGRSPGPPPTGATPTIAAGLDRTAAEELFASVTPAARIDNGIGPDTEEHDRSCVVSDDKLG